MPHTLTIEEHFIALESLLESGAHEGVARSGSCQDSEVNVKEEQI